MISKIAQFIAGFLVLFSIVGWLLIVITLLAKSGLSEIPVAILVIMLVAALISKKVRGSMMRAGRIFFMVPKEGDIDESK